MKKENKSITELNWWKNKSTSRGLTKDHPILIRENDASTDRRVIKEKQNLCQKILNSGVFRYLIRRKNSFIIQFKLIK